MSNAWEQIERKRERERAAFWSKFFKRLGHGNLHRAHGYRLLPVVTSQDFNVVRRTFMLCHFCYVDLRFILKVVCSEQVVSRTKKICSVAVGISILQSLAS